MAGLTFAHALCYGNPANAEAEKLKGQLGALGAAATNANTAEELEGKLEQGQDIEYWNVMGRTKIMRVK